MKTAFATIALAFGVSLVAAHAQEPGASAAMADPEGADLGTVTIESTPSGFLHVTVEMEGLPPGAHGFHIHETGECAAEDGFESAGGHYAGDRDHGVRADGGPHPGDFPNVHVGEDGILIAEFFTDRLSMEEGAENTLMDEDGSAVVVHSGEDDYESQPSGEAGDRIACGVVEMAN